MIFKYGKTLLKSESDKDNLDMTTFAQAEVDEEIINIVGNDRDFAETTTFGNKDVGNPVEYEKLVITHNEITRTFDFYNKGIISVFSKDESDKHIFKVFYYFAEKLHNEKKKTRAK